MRHSRRLGLCGISADTSRDGALHNPAECHAQDRTGPLFLLWFGLGIGSKVAVGSSLAFFIVLSATIAGMRSVDRDHLVLSRALGATPSQIFFKVTLPSAVSGHFLGRTARHDFRSVGGRRRGMIAAEHGLGQIVAYLQATFNVDGVMAILLLLALLGLGASSLMSRLERRLLVWQ